MRSFFSIGNLIFPSIARLLWGNHLKVQVLLLQQNPATCILNIVLSNSPKFQAQSIFPCIFPLLSNQCTTDISLNYFPFPLKV